MTDQRFTVHAPGRVNLIGDHTDYAGGLALPCAIDLGITLHAERGGTEILLTSDAFGGNVVINLTEVPEIQTLNPLWGRYVAAVAAECTPKGGFRGSVASTLPAGAGLSSSAALEIALAVAMQFNGSQMELALLGQRSEHRAVGVPCGLLDQLSIVFGKRDHAMVIDFSDNAIDHVVFPEDLDIVIMHSGQVRELVDSEYAERRSTCEQAAQRIGPLANASLSEIATLDGDLERRARHVVSECERVRKAAVALHENDPATFGQLMLQSHASLRDDFDVSTSVLDELVDRLSQMPGVYGARLTGAGFGGCVVALCERDAIRDPSAMTGRGWRVRPSDGARVISE
ncbi:MAG: galactokinase [Acidimicrobiia bacterium]|nr:galactokinase [Acidimicrobiia bacterium]